MIDTQTHGLEFYLWTTVIQDCFPSPSCLSSDSQSQLVLSWSSSQSHNYVETLTCASDAMRLPYLELQILTLILKHGSRLLESFLKWVCVRGYDPQSFLEALVYKTKAAENSNTAYCNVSFLKLRYIHLECPGHTLPIRVLYRSTR